MSISGVVIKLDAASFRREFKAYGREENFTFCGQDALFAELEEYSDSTGEPYELDVIALCCEFSEYTVQELIKEYGMVPNDLCAFSDHDGDWKDLDDGEIRQALVDHFQGETTVIEVDNGKIILGAH